MTISKNSISHAFLLVCGTVAKHLKESDTANAPRNLLAFEERTGGTHSRCDYYNSSTMLMSNDLQKLLRSHPEEQQ